MSPDFEDDAIDLEDYSNQVEKAETKSIEEDSIDMEDYSSSPEAEEASWWDVAKDIVIQPALGALNAFTWPASLLKYGMTQQALGDMDELQETYRKQGKEFDADQYIKDVNDRYGWVPTQELLEEGIANRTGLDLNPKSETGKGIRQFFTLATLARQGGAGAPAAIKSGLAGAGTTAALKGVGVPETPANIAGDVISGGTQALKTKGPRKLSPEAQEIKTIADKHGLPFLEHMTEPNAERVGKITEGRRAALDKKLGMSSKEAIDQVIEGKLPRAKLKKAGQDLDILEADAYKHVDALTDANKTKLSMNNAVDEIRREAERIKSLAPLASTAEKDAIAVLEQQADALEKATPTAKQVIKQTKNNNSNVKNLYRKPEVSGSEQEIMRSYAFVNNTLRNEVERQTGPEIGKALKEANAIHGENVSLMRTESLLNKAFKNDKYSPAKLDELLNSRQGIQLRKDIGKDGVKDLKDIAKYGKQAKDATTQLAKTSMGKKMMQEWGPLAGFTLAHIPGAHSILLAAKPISDYLRGYILTNPAARTVYKDIMKNASNGTFKNMGADFKSLEKLIEKDYGSVDDFLSAASNELEIYDF